MLKGKNTLKLGYPIAVNPFVAMKMWETSAKPDGAIMTERATAEDAETQAPVQAAAVFGDDDLGRLQGILFGDHARKTSERIDTLEQALLGAIADLRDQMTEQIETVSAQLAAETETRYDGSVQSQEQDRQGQSGCCKGDRTCRTHADHLARPSEGLTRLRFR